MEGRGSPVASRSYRVLANGTYRPRLDSGSKGYHPVYVASGAASSGDLKLEGRVAISDINNEHPEAPHRDHPDVQVTAADIKAWMAAAGFRLAEEYYLFEKKYFLVFERAAS